MMFHVSSYDSLLYHTRAIYLNEWNESLSSFQQYLMATGSFATKIGATRWVRKKVMGMLEQNGGVMYHQDLNPG